MTDPVDQRHAYGGAHQAYFLEVPGAASAAELSVVSFEAVERLGDTYTVTIRLTHPLPLDRADYLGKDARFLIDPGDGTAPRKFGGCITGFSETRQTHDFCAYEIVVEPLVARLRLTRASRVYQHLTAPQIIEAILRRHGLQGHQFLLKTRRKYPQYKFRLQYQMSDWDYIRLLMEQEGLYCYFLLGKFGEMAVFGDDIDHYIYLPELRVPYRETAGLESGVEAVTDLKSHARTVPESILVADYNPEQSWERIQAEANIARKDKTTYGQSYVYGSHHLDKDGAKWEAQLRHEAAIAWQLIYEGASNVLELQASRILRMDRVLPDAPNGLVIIEVRHSGGRDAAYRNTFKAIPSDRRFRLPLAEDKWPRIHGTLSARVTSPGQYKYAYLTQAGHYTVRFDLDFDTSWPKGCERAAAIGQAVCRVAPDRLSLPGARWDRCGDCVPRRQPEQAVYRAFPSQQSACRPDHQPGPLAVAQCHPYAERQQSRTGRLGGRGTRTAFHRAFWQSQLTLGHMVNGERQKRGEGFELRTSGWGAIRGGKGLFISADDQPNAGAAARNGCGQTSSLRRAGTDAAAQRAAAAAKVQLADIARQRDLMEQRLLNLQQAVILLSAPAGIALATAESIQLAANGNVIASAGSNLDLGAGKRITIAAGRAHRSLPRTTASSSWLRKPISRQRHTPGRCSSRPPKT